MTVRNIIFIGIFGLFFPFLLRGQQTSSDVAKTTIGNANTLTGKVFYDQNKDEQFNNEPVLKHWFVKAVHATTGQTYWTSTDETGTYQFKLDIGTYKISVITPNRYWSPFQQDTYTTFKTLDSEVSLDFAVKSAHLSPAMQVEMVAANFSTQTENAYTIRFANNGTTTAKDAFVQVSLDESLEFVRATQPRFSQNGQIVRFNLGDVPVNGFGNFTVYTKANSQIPLSIGQNLCTEAHIFPDTLSGLSVLNSNSSWSVVRSGDNMARYSKNHIITEDVIIFAIPVNPDLPTNNGDSLDQIKIDFNTLENDSLIRVNDRLALRAFQTAYFSNTPQSISTPFNSRLCHFISVFQANLVNNNQDKAVLLTHNVRVYPNPVHEVATFEIANNEANSAQLFIFDNMGKLMQKADFVGNYCVFQRKSLSEGVYFYKIVRSDRPLSIGKILVVGH